MLKIFLLSTAALLVFVVLALSGALNMFMDDGAVDMRFVTHSAPLYWALFNMIAWLVLKGRKYWRQLILSIVMVAICLAFAEYALRKFFPLQTMSPYRSVRSGRFHHCMPPNQNMRAGRSRTDPRRHVFVRTNEDGLRTDYSRREFLREGLRIVVMGDSFTFGLGVRQEDVFARQLEENLREQMGRGDIGVLNAGIISYSPFLQRFLMRDILQAYKPHHVLLFLDVSDIGDDWRYINEADMSAPPDSVFGESGATYSGHNAAYYGALWRVVNERLPGLINWFVEGAIMPYHFIRQLILGEENVGAESYDYYDFSVTIDGEKDTNRFFIYRYPLAKTQSFFDATFSNIQMIAQLARGAGAFFTLIPIPRYHHWNTNECPNNWETGQYGLNEPYQYEFFRYFSNKAGQVDFKIEDLLTPFRETTEYPLVFDMDPHWNEAGHAFVGEVVSDMIAAQMGEEQTEKGYPR